MHTYRRLLILASAAAVFVALFAVPAVAGSAGQFISKINASRSSAGLPPVESYWDLADDARRHSNSMAERGELYHSGNLGSVTSGWTGLGENVGVGLDVSSLHQAFMNSSGHRRNILGDYNYVGIGVTVDDDGFMWVTAIFMKAAGGLNDPPDTTTTAPPTTTTTTTRPPPPTTTTTTAPPTTTTTTTRPPPPTTTTTTWTLGPTTTTTTTWTPTTTTTTTWTPDATTTSTAPDPSGSQTGGEVGDDGSGDDGVPIEFYEIWGEHFVYGNPNPPAYAI